MKNVTITDGAKAPEAYISKQRQRVKQHSTDETHAGILHKKGTVYLKNGDNFEIELFNPTKNKLLATIELNGKPMGSGIVLRPGERVFLERHMDEPKKLLFETYDVNSSDKDAMKAIENNGKVKVVFKKEASNTWSTITHTYSPEWISYPQFGNKEYFYPTTREYCSMGNLTSSASYSYSCSPLNSGEISNISCSKDGLILSDSEIETGRIEKGNKSNQDFTYDHSDFDNFPWWTYEWTILPESRKLATVEDLVSYCSNCGRRKRGNERYCPSCGQKL